MLRFEVDVTAADTESRTIEGLAVPYGEHAQLGERAYSFTEGSLRPARARTPLLLGHDTNRPVGVLTQLEDTANGAVARFKIDRGSEGDLALEQAQSGSRAGLSIGASIVEAQDGEDGVRVVTQASLMEVSLCAIPAFAGAGVTSVTAEASDPDTPNESEEDTVEEIHQEEAPEPVAAEHAPSITVVAERPRRDLTAHEFIMASHKAAMGDRASQELVQAALTVVDTNNVPGLLPDAITNTIIGGVPSIRALAGAVRNVALPATGLKVVKPRWDDIPQVDNIGFNDDAPSGPVAIINHEVDLVQWAWGGAVSVAVMERAASDYATNVYTKIIESYYGVVETALATTLSDTVTATSNTAATVGGCIAAVYQLSKRPADTLLVSPDVYGNWLDDEGVLKFATGALSNQMGGNAYGARVIVSPVLSSGTVYAVASSQITLSESSPIRLTATNVGGLQIELGATGFYCIDVEDDTAIVALD